MPLNLAALTDHLLANSQGFAPDIVPGATHGGGNGVAIPTAFQCLIDCLLQRIDIACGNQYSVCGIDDFARAADIRGDHGSATGDCFDNHVGIALGPAWQGQQISGTDPFGDLCGLASS